MNTTSSLATAIAVYLPGIAAAIFILGVLYRTIGWLRTPRTRIPFKIFPSGGRSRAIAGQVVDILFFPGLIKISPSLWFISWPFHAALLLMFVGHLRLFSEITLLWNLLRVDAGNVDRAAFLTGSAFGLLFLATTLGLLVRRLASQSVRSLSIFGDYFALGLLLAIGVSGMAMRVWGHADVVTYRSFFVSLVALHPLDPPRDLLFLSHFFLGQMLLIYFPFGKLWHSVGIIQTDGKRRGTI